MNEQDLVKKIQNYWLGHIIKVESTTISGIPDLNICWMGIETWLEVKMLRGNYIYLEKFQPQFHINRYKFGGNCFILCGNTERVLIVKIRDAFSIQYTLEMNKFKRFDITDERQVEILHCWTKPFNWPNMFEEFMKGLGYDSTRSIGARGC